MWRRTRWVLAMCLGVLVFGAAAGGAGVAAEERVDRLILEPLDQFGGSVTAVEVAGRYAYVGVGPRMVVLDIADPALPRPVGRSPELPNIVQDLAVNGRYVYAAVDLTTPSNRPMAAEARAGSPGPAGLTQDLPIGLYVLDVADPARPTIVAEIGPAPDEWWWEGIRRVVLAGDRLYLVANGVATGLRIYDVSAPSSPRQLGSFADTDFSFEANDLAVLGHHLYVAGGDVLSDMWCNHGYRTFMEVSELTVVDMADPARPELRLTLPSATRLASDGRFVYVVGDGHLQVLDASDPVAPRPLGMASLARGPTRAVLNDSLLYVAGDGATTLSIVDVADPNTPRLLSETPTGEETWDVAVSGHHAFVVSRRDGLVVLDVAEPEAPRVVGRYRPIGRLERLVAMGDRLLAHDSCGLADIDVADPAEPRVAARFDRPAGEGWLSDIVVHGDSALVGHATWTERGGLIRLDRDAAGDLAALPPLDTFGGVSALAVAGDVAYLGTPGWISDARRIGLVTVNVGQPGSLTALGDTSLTAPLIALAAGDGFVHGVIRRRIDPFHVEHEWATIDVRDPAAPRIAPLDASELGPAPRGDHIVAPSLARRGPHLLVGGDGVYDVSDPTRPRHVTDGPLPTRFQLDGNRLYGAYYASVAVFDVADVTAPRYLGGGPVAHTLRSQPGDAVAVGDILYVAAGEWGLQSFRMVPAPYPARVYLPAALVPAPAQTGAAGELRRQPWRTRFNGSWR